MEEKISKLTVGIRYRRSFRVSGITGEIVDFVLRDESSPFGKDFFTKVGDTQSKGNILLNETGDESLVFDMDSLVLTLKSSDLKDTIKKIETVYYPYLNTILKNFNVENFNRLGIIFEFHFEGSSIVNKAIAELTSSKIESPDNLEMRFSKKLPATESMIKKEVVDYNNAIYTYIKNTEGLTIRVDYQTYFNPEISSIRDVPFSKFIESAQSYIKKNVYA